MPQTSFKSVVVATTVLFVIVTSSKAEHVPFVTSHRKVLLLLGGTPPSRPRTMVLYKVASSKVPEPPIKVHCPVYPAGGGEPAS